MDQVKFFKGCLPQILVGLFLNILTHIYYQHITTYHMGEAPQICTMSFPQRFLLIKDDANIYLCH